MQTQAAFRFAIAGSILWSTVACAQTEEQLTLDTAVAVALQHNRQLRSSRIDVMKVGDRLAAAQPSVCRSSVGIRWQRSV